MRYRVAETPTGFAITDVETDEVENLTIDEACSVVLKQVYDSLHEARDTVCRQYEMDRDRLAAPGALFLRCTDFESMLASTDKMKVRFVPSRYLQHIEDPRVRKGLELTQQTRDALLIVNFQIHSRNREKGEDGNYKEPGPVGLLILSPSNKCGNVDCDAALDADTVALARSKKGEIPYCRGACRKEDYRSRKRLSKFCKTNLGIQNMKLTERDTRAVPSFDLDTIEEEALAPVPASVSASRPCAVCKEARGRGEFSKTQWKLSARSHGKGGACRLCIGASTRAPPEMT